MEGPIDNKARVGVAGRLSKPNDFGARLWVGAHYKTGLASLQDYRCRTLAVEHEPVVAAHKAAFVAGSE